MFILMNLTEYLAATGIRPADMARRLSVPSNTFSQWVHGQRMPAADKLLALERETQGRVTATDIARTRVAYLEAAGRGEVPQPRAGIRGRRPKEPPTATA